MEMPCLTRHLSVKESCVHYDGFGSYSAEVQRGGIGIQRSLLIWISSRSIMCAIVVEELRALGTASTNDDNPGGVTSEKLAARLTAHSVAVGFPEVEFSALGTVGFI